MKGRKRRRQRKKDREQEGIIEDGRSETRTEKGLVDYSSSWRSNKPFGSLTHAKLSIINVTEIGYSRMYLAIMNMHLLCSIGQLNQTALY